MRRSTYRTASVQIIGTLAGHIWMPVATKEVCHTMQTENATVWRRGVGYVRIPADEVETLREALCTIIADGDFQSCGLMYGAIIKVIRTNASGTKRVRRWRIRFACWETEDIMSGIEEAELLMDEVDA